MSNHFLPYMNEGGSILNIASTVGLRAMRGAAAYCASKGGVVNLTKAMALDLAGKIRVNCICPAVVDTPMVDERVQSGNISRQVLEKVQPIGRMGKPAEIASMALHLCGPEAEWTTGSIITVDGGQTAAQIQPILLISVNYYDILGVEKNADSESIKKAYKKLAKQYHPDLNPEEVESSEEHFKKINEAYHVLIDEKERKKYDQFGSEYIPRKAPQWQATNVWTNNTWDYIR